MYLMAPSLECQSQVLKGMWKTKVLKVTLHLNLRESPHNNAFSLCTMKIISEVKQLKLNWSLEVINASVASYDQVLSKSLASWLVTQCSAEGELY